MANQAATRRDGRQAVGNEGGALPPSTLAAQIVEQHSASKGKTLNDDSTFRQLLDEIRASPKAVEADPEGNYKLITVVAEAGLSNATFKDPFTSPSFARDRVSACLEVIEVALRRTPSILMHNAQNPNPDNALFWLLLSKVVSLLAFPDMQKILRRFLRDVVLLLSRSPGNWEDKILFTQILKVGAEDADTLLKKQLNASSKSMAAELSYPSSAMLNTVVPNQVSLVAALPGKRVAIQTYDHTLGVIATFVAAACLSTPTGEALTNGNVSTLHWGVKVLCDVWRDSIAKCVPNHAPPVSAGSLAAVLKSINKILCMIISLEKSVEKANGLLQFPVECIQDLLDRPIILRNPDIEMSFVLSCLVIICATKNNEPAMYSVEIGLKPKLTSFSSNTSVFETFPDHICQPIRVLMHITGPKGSQWLKSLPPQSLSWVSEKSAQSTIGELWRNLHEEQVSVEAQDEQPSRKRLRREEIRVDGNASFVELKDLLRGWDQQLPHRVEGNFADLEEETRPRVFELIGKCFCNHAAADKSSTRLKPDCISCAGGRMKRGKGTSNPMGEDREKCLIDILIVLIKSNTVTNSNKMKIAAMLAVVRVACHTSMIATLNINDGELGKWCLQCLRSQSRELRLASSKALKMFLTSDYVSEEETFKQNRITALNVLRSLSRADEIRVFETVVLAFGQVAQVCQEDELNLILLQLIDYLGNPNALLSSLAYLEIQNIAVKRNESVEDLIRPYWRTIAIAAVKDLRKRPQKLQHLAELLSWSVSRLLRETQEFTLPYLVLWGQVEVLQRMAKEEGDVNIWDLCLRPKNLSAVLALLLSQHPENGEAIVEQCLKAVKPDVNPTEITSLFKVDPPAVARLLLLMACQTEDTEKEKATQAFREYAQIVERRGHSTRSSTTQARMVSLFCENNALGIVNYLSSSIESPSESSIEKKRAVQAVEHLILTAKSDATVALPQILACLHSSFDKPCLCNTAFSAWAAVLEVAEGETLESIINQTFVLIVQKWNVLDASNQKKAYDTIASILRDYGSLVQGIVDRLPSLESIEMIEKFESQLSRFRSEPEVRHKLWSFAKRCEDENSLVVLQSLRELRPYLEQHQRVVHDSAVAENPLPIISDLVRSLLDASNRFSGDAHGIPDLCAECLGVIGCLDPNRVETIKEANIPLMQSNFKQAGEAIEFVSFLLQHVLVKAFQSTSNTRAQGFLAYVMQELLKFCGYNKDALASYRPRGSQGDGTYQQWMQLPEATRQTLAPFLSSHYVLKANTSNPMAGRSYPIYTPEISRGTWLRDFLLDLINKISGENARMIFNVVARIVRTCDISIVSLLLPYTVANVVLDGSNDDSLLIGQELLAVLQQPIEHLSLTEIEHLKYCSENVFDILDYLSRWMQNKKRIITTNRSLAERTGRSLEPVEDEQERVDLLQISNVEALLSRIPSDIISRRASECGSFARAVLHWEKYIRSVENTVEGEVPAETKDVMNRHLQDLYVEIDEPDGIEGLSLSLHALDPEQQAMEHRRAGRWAAAQSWYSLNVEDQPLDKGAHVKLLSCLKEASRYTSIIQHVDGISDQLAKEPLIQSIAAEAAWCTNDWNWLTEHLEENDDNRSQAFNIVIGLALRDLRAEDSEKFLKRVQTIRREITRNLSGSTTSSLQACRDQLFKLHALYELEFLSGIKEDQIGDNNVHLVLERRLDVLGSSQADKQYLLSLRRAVAQLSKQKRNYDIASSWMTTAKLARKGPSLAPAYDAVYRAAKLGDESSAIEQARLLWKGGEHRNAIQSLESAMGSSLFTSTSGAPAHSVVATSTINPTTSFGASLAQDPQAQHKMLTANAQLLMAKWMDRAGQTSGDVILQQYRLVTFTFQKWEKGLYNLGKFYNKLLEFERAQPLGRQGIRCLSGETPKLVIENFLRSLTFGCKYINETLPKLLTLWLDHGTETLKKMSGEIPNDVRERVSEQRPKFLDGMNKQIKKYSEKISTFVFYTALTQMVTRISHENQSVWEVLAHLIVKVVATHPQQGLWSLLAITKSSTRARASRGNELLNRLKQSNVKTIRNEGTSVDLRDLVARGQKLSDELLRACEVAIQGRATHVSLTRDLGFKVKVAPCPLVIPWEKTLTASLPFTTSSREMRVHKAFPMSREAVTVSSFEDNVLVLSSLQKPRKLVVKGSDGQKYGLLCKPNDDLRKDQRLMEFNAMINKALKKDTEASARRLYVKTYAVTPLNEACGLIEWVEGLKPLRDILIALYKSKGVKIDYNLLRQLLADACANPPDSTDIFTKQLLDMYYPILHEWFTENFPSPDAWYAARTRYTRSCAVTSIVGNALGLGDRHGENVLLEEKTGGVFHVDFNCLFDKGLTFEKPEIVPFRLTHNMVDAMGATGVEGFYRRAAETTLRVMREKQDALLTILETFVYDPTADFMGSRHRTNRVITVPGITDGIGHGQIVPDTPREVLESVRRKLKGMLPGESLPLNVQGYVAALVNMATDPQRLARMYIGWCAFL